jgi:tetratricopeptide (TPR) repeat protein
VRLAYTLSILSYAYRAQGKRDEFAAAVQRAMAILESAAGSNHRLLPRSLTVLAMAHLRFGFEPDTTLAQFNRSLPILEKDLVRDHPAIGLQLAGLAAAYLARSQPEQAKPYLTRALAIAEQQYLPDHVSLANGLMKVVEIYTDQGNYAQAYAVAQRVVVILGKMLDPDHPDVIMATERYRLLKQKMNQAAEIVSLAAATTVPIQVAGNAMFVHAIVNHSQRVFLLVDSGASSTLIRPLVLTRLGLTVPPDAPRHRLTVVGGQTLDVPFVTVAMQVGDATIEHLEVAVAEALPGSPDLDGLLGADFLQRFKVTLEKTARRMTLEPLPR